MTRTNMVADRRPAFVAPAGVDANFEAGAKAFREGKDIFTYSDRLNHHEAGAYMDGWIAEKKKP